MAALGKKTLGLGYGVIATDLILAPAIPSNTARAGGIIFPLLKATARAYGSTPEDGTAHKIGAFLTLAAFQGNVITSTMFLTAMAANPLAAKLAGQMHIDLSWGTWALAAAVPGNHQSVGHSLRRLQTLSAGDQGNIGRDPTSPTETEGDGKG